MNSLKERIKRFAVMGLAAVLITAQVPQVTFGAEAEAGPVEVAQVECTLKAAPSPLKTAALPITLRMPTAEACC